MNLAANPESVPVEAIDALTRSLMLGEEIEATFRMDEPSGEDRHHPPDQADQGAGFPSLENDDDDDIVADESFRFPWIDSF
ncbi:hypothetical protein [Singulisphaera sp. PoT]|uniref:hypothetical protein n=1 Tax=Singulisphaera sp. PoT TaxID=3411797 RepID=UPI003BF4DD74